MSTPPSMNASKKTYDSAMLAGLWKGKYASVNHHEYWAEGVQSWFDKNGFVGGLPFILLKC